MESNAITVPVPVKRVNGNDWLILSGLSKKGLLRAVKIDKRKKPVADWDGHHCDEALAEGSIRYNPKWWQMQ